MSDNKREIDEWITHLEHVRFLEQLEEERIENERYRFQEEELEKEREARTEAARESEEKRKQADTEIYLYGEMSASAEIQFDRTDEIATEVVDQAEELRDQINEINRDREGLGR